MRCHFNRFPSISLQFGKISKAVRCIIQCTWNKVLYHVKVKTANLGQNSNNVLIMCLVFTLSPSILHIFSASYNKRCYSNPEKIFWWSHIHEVLHRGGVVSVTAQGLRRFLMCCLVFRHLRGSCGCCTGGELLKPNMSKPTGVLPATSQLTTNLRHTPSCIPSSSATI